jgi:hypothetical protein
MLNVYHRAILCLNLLAVTIAAAIPAHTVRANPPDPEAPPGFFLILAEIGVQLYQKDYPGGNPDYVQVIDLSAGAAVVPLHGNITEARVGKGVYGGGDPRFELQTLPSFWQDFSAANSRAFCVTNGQFFYLPENPTRLPFPLKKGGNIITDGYGIKDFPGKKLMLEIWPDRARIRRLTRQALHASTAPDIIAGLSEEANKRARHSVGRTFTGIDDRDGDGRYETILIFNTRTARQADAAEVLRDFGADQVMMLDGGGSTQLICQDITYIASDRWIPQAIAVLAGEDNLLPEISLKQAVKTSLAVYHKAPASPPITPGDFVWMVQLYWDLWRPVTVLHILYFFMAALVRLRQKD